MMPTVSLRLCGLLLCMGLLTQCAEKRPAAAPLRLKAAIGLASLPADSARICPAPPSNAPMDISFESAGLKKGDTVPDFTLYGPDGREHQLSKALAAGQPVLLVSGSFTCDIMRANLPEINRLAAKYAGKLKVFLVYVIEAHPAGDVCPYMDHVWELDENKQAGIVFAQPRTYGERKAVLAQLMQHDTVNVPVLLDGPCNPFWLTYGRAPNSAWLIGPDGVLRARQGWFSKKGKLDADIDQLLAAGH